MIRCEAVGAQFVAMLRAALPRDQDSVADLDGLRRVDAHHGKGDVGIETVEHRLAESRGHATCAHGDPGAGFVTVGAQLPQVVFEER